MAEILFLFKDIEKFLQRRKKEKEKSEMCKIKIHMYGDIQLLTVLIKR